jgi:hypothetical protein
MTNNACPSGENILKNKTIERNKNRTIENIAGSV